MRILRYIFGLSVLISVSACYPLCNNGCFVYLGTLAPDFELPKWTKYGVDSYQRREDSRHCGSPVQEGDPSPDDLKFGQNYIIDKKIMGETDKQTQSRLVDDWQRCMFGKGYRYIGKCYDNEISRAQPKCGAP